MPTNISTCTVYAHLHFTHTQKYFFFIFFSACTQHLMAEGVMQVKEDQVNEETAQLLVCLAVKKCWWLARLW